MRLPAEPIDAPHAAIDVHWMQHALHLAECAERDHDEIPVGALIVGAEGNVLGEGWNFNIASHDPSAHAEIVAMRDAGRRLSNHRLIGCTLYVTLEPCAMCDGDDPCADRARGVRRKRPKTGACGACSTCWPTRATITVCGCAVACLRPRRACA